MLTINEAAARLAVTAATLRQQIHAGRLKARKLGPIWVIDESDLMAYRLAHSGRTGRPFVGAPGYVDTPHVRVRLFLAPADGRGKDAIWLQYLNQSFVLDLELENPKLFRPTRSTYEMLDLLTGTPPGGRTFEFWNREHVAKEFGVDPGTVTLRLGVDSYFPRPVVTFRDGPIWEAGQFEHFASSRGPVTDWSRQPLG